MRIPHEILTLKSNFEYKTVNQNYEIEYYLFLNNIEAIKEIRVNGYSVYKLREDAMERLEEIIFENYKYDKPSNDMFKQIVNMQYVEMIAMAEFNNILKHLKITKTIMPTEKNKDGFCRYVYECQILFLNIIFREYIEVNKLMYSNLASEIDDEHIKLLSMKYLINFTEEMLEDCFNKFGFDFTGKKDDMEVKKVKENIRVENILKDF